MDMGHARAGADAAPLIHTTCSAGHSKITELPAQTLRRWAAVVVVFVVAFVVGLIATLSTLVVAHFIGGRDGDGPPFGVLSKAVGIMAPASAA
jgi:hypothetical protein